jgi:ATP-dependent RNA helicase DDX5/DBP2
MNQVPSLIIVFVDRKARCDEILNVLVEYRFKTIALHGG